MLKLFPTVSDTESHGRETAKPPGKKDVVTEETWRRQNELEFLLQSGKIYNLNDLFFSFLFFSEIGNLS